MCTKVKDLGIRPCINPRRLEMGGCKRGHGVTCILKREVTPYVCCRGEGDFAILQSGTKGYPRGRGYTRSDTVVYSRVIYDIWFCGSSVFRFVLHFAAFSWRSFLGWAFVDRPIPEIVVYHNCVQMYEFVSAHEIQYIIYTLKQSIVIFLPN